MTWTPPCEPDRGWVQPKADRREQGPNIAWCLVVMDFFYCLYDMLDQHQRVAVKLRSEMERFVYFPTQLEGLHVHI